MPPTPTDPSEPQRPQQGQRRAYQPPPGAAKPQAPPPAPGPRPAAGQAPMQGGAAQRPLPAGAAAAAAARSAGNVGLRGKAYEYSFGEDGLIKDLARNISTVSWVLLALGLVLLVRNFKPILDAVGSRAWSSLLDPAIAYVGAFILIYSFIGLRQAGSNFALIPESQGLDQQLTVSALRGLNKLFSVLALIVIVMSVLVLVSFVIGFLSTREPAKPIKKKETPKVTGTAWIPDESGIPALAYRAA